MKKTFKSLLVSKKNDSTFYCSIKTQNINQLPNNDLLIKVLYSSLNFKDALSMIGNKGVTKNYPHTPGIDAVGIVVNSKRFPINSMVIVSGYDLGMNTHGGFSEFISVPEEWAVLKPKSLNTKESMILGTAGLTAGLCVDAFLERNNIENKNAIVSGATGGVGSIAVKLLSTLGANVTAITGKEESHGFLKKLGAKSIIKRKVFLDSSNSPLEKGYWDFALDVAGGKTLSKILRGMNYGGIITCCGLVDNPKFQSTVYPFILRANQLIGIDSAEAPIEKKEKIWKLFSNKWKLDNIEELAKVISFDDLNSECNKILKGQLVGRVVLQINKKLKD